ncbi:ribosomal RNA large subunit methyltransferase I [Parapedobacter defluvii]|uniref:Ribosomal RNA large subunit methyltransferase I n=1 Tax=Parapedobacter defluvii TaxID=2045106 RepID=A0ABQ1M6I5_9SPHI|nr:class I SAM-dependent rRNA methyltransferase [Parapedobacter defluvii]GGC34175.1 ribosomal RNA large subunit methyltransferase I [Parapedobacter defluvii]
MHTIKLKKDKTKAAHQRHPWIFSGAVAESGGRPQDGDVVRVVDHLDEFIAYGLYNGQSRVAVRLIEWDVDRFPDEDWWRVRVRRAVEARNPLLRSSDTNTVRLIFAESDFLPGLIVDKYADFLSIQIHASGVERVKQLVTDELNQLLNPQGIYERSDANARQHEGLVPANGVLSGNLPPEWLEIKENGIRYQVNIAEGQKSGFYCDQRDNRLYTAHYACGKRVLDCFCYSGGFSLNAFAHGAASVVSVDSSALAMETLKRNVAVNGFDESKHIAIQADVNRQLRIFSDSGQRFDLIVLDPPKYAPSRSRLEKAARAYKDLNRRGLLLLEQGGLLATFSCSAAMDMATFKQILAWAALDAGKEIQFIRQFTQSDDHPVRASFPEGEYLKGLLCRVV